MFKSVVSRVFLILGLAALCQGAGAEGVGPGLTPMGAEAAANADGSIPAWTGGGVTVPAGYKPGGHYPDPFASEKPLFTITAENAKQYADKLTVGQKAMLDVYAKTWKMNVYPSHRTAQYPQWVYERTAACAKSAKLTADGNGVTGAHACVPFPVPKNGLEVVWNHLLRFQGVYRVESIDSAAPDANGRYVLAKITRNTYWPYWDLKKPDSELLSMFIPRQLSPPRVAGDTYLFIDHVDASKSPRQAWRYFAGQRRVRRAPVFDFDTPIPPAEGLQTVDTYDNFFGSPEKYDWKLKGKKEIYIPYNSYRLGAGGIKNDDIIKAGHINPDLIRYELHRVWVVEATLKSGERHIYPKRELYVDEDSWTIVVHDMYDEKGQLWRTGHKYPMLYWEVPLLSDANESQYDLISRRYYVVGLTGEYPRGFDYSQPPPDEAFFTPASIERMGVR